MANAISLPEIYNNAAHYIDPFHTDVDLDELLEQSINPPETVPRNYSYERSAQWLYAAIQEYTDSQ